MSDGLLVPCVGGPVGSVGWRRVTDPPPFEIEAPDGMFLLDRDGDDIRYVFVETA